MFPKCIFKWHFMCFMFKCVSFKANMILLMLYLIHIKCLKEYFQSNLEHLDGQFHFHPLAV